MENKQGHENDFYNIGAMGCAQSIAFGISLQEKEKKVFVFDGDGAVLMQMGAFATIGHYAPEGFHHIIFDNQAHDSTGGQPTCSDTVKFNEIAVASGYKAGRIVETKEELEKVFPLFKKEKGPSLLVVKVKKGARGNLGRPVNLPVEYKKDFMKSVLD